jgi:hypothetical protein
MAGRRPLKGRAPRLLGFHGGAEGKAYRRGYDALEMQYGPFSSELLRFEAGRVAVARMQLERATMELTKAQRDRRCGKGRRPNLQQIERLARRQGLADQTYVSALKRLEELAEQQRSADPLSALLRT